MDVDIRAFLVDNWGNPDKVTALLQAYGHKEVRRAAINQWFRRGRIPTEWGMRLILLAELESGATLSLRKYLI